MSACRAAKRHAGHRVRQPWTVLSGKVVLDDASLLEGADVYVFAPRAAGVAHLLPDEVAEVEAGLAEEAARETVSGDEFLKELRSPVKR